MRIPGFSTYAWNEDTKSVINLKFKKQLKMTARKQFGLQADDGIKKSMTETAIRKQINGDNSF